MEKRRMDNNGEIRGTWKGYKELWGSLGSTNEEKISTQQKISNGIKAFSDYMSHAGKISLCRNFVYESGR